MMPREMSAKFTRRQSPLQLSEKARSWQANGGAVVGRLRNCSLRGIRVSFLLLCKGAGRVFVLVRICVEIMEQMKMH